jgi:hypothetical protein
VKVQYGSTWLASGGVDGAFGLVIDGQQANEVAQIFRAASVSSFARLNRSARVSFKVNKIYNSESALITALANLLTALDTSNLLTLYDETQGTAILMYGAVIDYARHAPPVGLSVVVEFGFRGGRFYGSLS